MPTPARPLAIAAALTSTVALAAAATPTGAATSSYATPKTGTWKVQDIFDYTAGGSAQVYKNGTRMRNLKLTLGPETADTCSGLSGTLKVIRVLKIPRVGSYKRPAIGRLSKKTKLIEPVSTRVKISGGKSEAATILALFEPTGKQAYTARILLPGCTINFALRK